MATMNVPLLPINRRWIQQELEPYLRCAFSHAIPYDADISAQIQCAIQFCMHKPDFPTDGSDLLFERICQAIEFRYQNLAPDLRLVTEGLVPLAKFLIRRAQLKGTYELLGRMNVASGAWRHHEKMRLDKLRLALDCEKSVNMTIPQPLLPRATPEEDQIDPRLINAQPGQYVSPELSGTLTTAEDQYYRHQKQMLTEPRGADTAVSSWQQQLHSASATSVRPSHQIFGRSWSYGQPLVAISPPKHPQPLSSVQGLGERQNTFAPQAHNRIVDAGQDGMLGGHTLPTLLFSSSTRSVPSAVDAYSLMTHPGAQPLEHKSSFARQQLSEHQLELEQLQTLSGSSNDIHQQPLHYNRSTTGSSAGMTSKRVPALAAVQATNLSHVRDNEWAQMAQHRLWQFCMLSQQEKAPKLMHFHQHQPTQGPIQRKAGGHAVQEFAIHPTYSNIRSTFPNMLFNA